jgi:hypothetical protein
VETSHLEQADADDFRVCQVGECAFGMQEMHFLAVVQPIDELCSGQIWLIDNFDDLCVVILDSSREHCVARRRLVPDGNVAPFLTLGVGDTEAVPQALKTTVDAARPTRGSQLTRSA